MQHKQWHTYALFPQQQAGTARFKAQQKWAELKRGSYAGLYAFLYPNRPIFFSSVLSNGTSFEESSDGRGRKISSCSSDMDKPAVVASSSIASNELTISPNEKLLPRPIGEVHPLIKNRTLHLSVWEVSGIPSVCQDRSFRNSFQNVCLCTVAPSTQKRYNSSLQKWGSWCETKQINPIQPSEVDIINFLQSLQTLDYNLGQFQS